MQSPTLRYLRTGLLVLTVLVVAACDTAEERAEKHYQSSLELLAAGDVERAIVELRNVFDLNGLHREARLTYAEVMRGRDNYGEAYRHYLLLSEQYPNDILSRIWLFRIALLADKFDQARRFGEQAVSIAPENPEVQAISAIIDYQTAVNDGDVPARRAAAERLNILTSELEDPLVAMPALIDNQMRDGELNAALGLIDDLLSSDPSLKQWQELRFQLLTRLGDDDAAEKQLLRMVERFPDDPTYPTSVIEWHSSRGDLDAAEHFMRDHISTSPDEVTREERKTLLVAFLLQTKGVDAAISELEALVPNAARPEIFRAMRAGLLFDKGDRFGAVEETQSIIEDGGDPGTIRDIKVTLAAMLTAVGDEASARERIAEVLLEDSAHVGALKQRAAWLIQDDQADQAIIELRTALASAPDDPQILTLMADAHLRNGSRNLAGEMLSLAVEASDNASGPSLGHARFLIAGRNYSAARDVLLEALRSGSNSPDALFLLGRLYVEGSDWARAERVEGALLRLGNEQGRALANSLKVERLRAQERGDEALRFLEQLVALDDDNSAAEVAVARTHMESGNFADAEAFINARLTEDPQRPVMRMLLAALYAQTNREEEANAVLRSLVEEDPTRELVWRTLYESRLRARDAAGASAILKEALAVLPDAPDLLWARAGELERSGDIDGAISIYEGLYNRLPDSPIVANNLASLLSTHRDNPEDLERAYSIARRLRGSDIPAFQDTYGWIAYQRKEFVEAIAHLEPAAQKLPEDASVQYHLGMAYAAAERYDEALQKLSRASEISNPGAARRIRVLAEAEIARITELIEAAGAAN